jgi:hypothetical protein
MSKAIRFGSLGDLFTKSFHVTRGASFAQLYTEVVPDLPKSSPYYGKVTKKQCHNVQLNFSYSNAVNNMRLTEGKEADFTPSLPKWGSRIVGTPLLTHMKKGDTETTFYLITRVLKSQQAGYFLNGEEVLDIPTLDSIRGDMRAPYSNKAHQGIEHEVVIRTFKLNSIRAITMDGETLVVEK